MSTVLQILKGALVALLRFGIAYALFAYLADFNTLQSVVLSIVALCAWDAYWTAGTLAAKQEPKFEPFWISVTPNWYAICRDFNLIEVEKWEEFLAEHNTNDEKYSVFRRGLNFVMLSQTLFYSNDHKSFFGELDLSITIDEIAADEEFHQFKPMFYVKRRVRDKKHRVIEFGLITSSSTKQSVHPRDDKDEIPLAQLHEIEFFGNFHPDLYWNHERKIAPEREQRLAEYGWAREERDTEDSWLNWPVTLTHKYFRLMYKDV